MKKVKKKILVLCLALIALQLVFLVQAHRSPQWQYAKKALLCKGANYDLRYCTDLPADARQDYTHTSWKPMPCINTATSFYNDKKRAGNCNSLVAHPDWWGFREVRASEAVPGDLMIFVQEGGRARHAGVYTMNSLLGPLCGNTFIHGYFLHLMPVKPLLPFRILGVSKVRYYRYCCTE